MSLTTKELMLIQDNIKSTETSINFIQGFAETITDTEVKTLCERIVNNQKSDVQMLVKHVNTATMQ